MKLNYHPDTDSLYIDLSEQTSVESREISEGVVLDYDFARDYGGYASVRWYTRTRANSFRVPGGWRHDRRLFGWFSNSDARAGRCSARNREGQSTH